MLDYQAPIKDMRFVFDSIVDIDSVIALPGFEDASRDLIDAILEESGKFTSEVIAPLNRVGDTVGAQYENGTVRPVEGFKEAYQQFVESGWGSLAFDPEFGGQGMPMVLHTAFSEMLNAANMSFALCPLLTQGAIDAIEAHGSDDLKETYLSKLVTGEWSGTMNLTEPQAGTDVGNLRTTAEKHADGSYRIKGQKIYITWGEHDMADNIVHLVLARLPDAPDGTKGISLFLVPRRFVEADGSLGARNDLRCAGIEEKIGIHGSPTCVMSYGDNEGAVGYLIGEENNGMAAMFTMMNAARLAVGLQGLAIAERAYQQARTFAKERVQSAALGGDPKTPVTIINHPDVRRNLLLMKSKIEAMRGLSYFVMGAFDRSRRATDEGERKESQAIVDLLTPVIKSWLTDNGVELASIGVQIHGGMGFVEETGAGQHYRDARILPIYEGTNGVQALDLMGRKTLRDGGAVAKAFIGRMAKTVEDLAGRPSAESNRLATNLSAALTSLTNSVNWVLSTGQKDILNAASGATAYQTQFGLVAGGWCMAQRLMAAEDQMSSPESDSGADKDFLDSTIKSAAFYGDTFLPEALAQEAAVMHSGTVNSLAESQF